MSATFMMAHPAVYDVVYSINPHMNMKVDANPVNKTLALYQWQDLVHVLNRNGAQTILLNAVDGCPDYVFTANAAVVLNKKVALSRYKYSERQLEEPHNFAVFHNLKNNGIIDKFWQLPERILLEGNGDCLWDKNRDMFWFGYGFRSNLSAIDYIETYFNRNMIELKLVDPRFYHLDTCFCPLPNGSILYYPEAFDNVSRQLEVFCHDLIPVNEEEALSFVCNSIVFDNKFITASCSDRLKKILEQRYFEVIEVPVTEFHKSGGSVFCMVLRLDHTTYERIPEKELTSQNTSDINTSSVVEAER